MKLSWLLLILITGTLSATTINVPTDYSTIQEGLDSAIMGDTVLVQPGVYFENLVWPGTNGIKLISALGPAETSIDGGLNSTVVEIQSSSIDTSTLISGFEIKNGLNSSGGSANGIYCADASPRFEDIVLSDNGSAWTSNPVFSLIWSDAMLSNVVMRDNISDWVGHLKVNQCNISAEYLTITSNNDASSIVVEGSELILDHCTFAGQNGSLANTLFVTASDVFISNSILWNNYAHQIVENGASGAGQISISNSAVRNGQESISLGDGSELVVDWAASNIDDNPLFCDPIAEDYSLSQISPCVGSGLLGSNMGAMDVACDEPILGGRALIHVSPVGSDDSGDGSADSPYQTIQQGINVSSHGDTVLIQPGQYFETIDYLGKNIIVGSNFLITGDTSFVSTTTLTGTGHGAAVQIHTGENYAAELSGISISGGASALWVNGADPYLHNLIISNNYSQTYNLITITYSNAVFENNRILENLTSRSLAYFHNGNIANSEFRNNRAEEYGLMGLNSLVNCIIADNESYQEMLANPKLINHCTITGNATELGGVLITMLIQGEVTFIHNSIIAGNSPCTPYDPYGEGYQGCGAGEINYVYDRDGYDYPGYASLVISNSIIGSLDTDNLQQGIEILGTILNSNPGLDESYFPVVNSPAIGGGVDSVSYSVFLYNDGWETQVTGALVSPSVDFNGNPRPSPIPSSPDIGALESQLSEPEALFGVTSYQTDGSILGGLTMLDENTIYAVSSNDKVYRLDSDLNYYYFLDVDGEIKSASTVTPDHSVYIASTDQNLYSFNSAGISNDNWPRAMGSQVTASVATDSEGNVYIGTENGIFQAVSPANESLWATNLGASVFASACISTSRRLYIPVSDGRIICYDLDSLDPSAPSFDWMLPTGSGIVSSPALDADGYLYVATLDGRVLKIQDNQEDSEILWTVTTGDSILSSPVIDSDGNILIGSNDAAFYSISPQGVINWSVDTGGKVRSTAAIGSTGRIYIGSDSQQLFAIDSIGSVIWRYFASSPISSPVLAGENEVFFGEENGLVVKITESDIGTRNLREINSPMWGTFQGNNQRTGNQAELLVSYDAQFITLPNAYVLRNNYPNPFNPSTTIRYGLPEESNVSLIIYDVRGQIVQTLESGHQSAGWYDVNWNGQTAEGHTLSTGIYFARLVAGDYSQVIKMLYLK